MIDDINGSFPISEKPEKRERSIRDITKGDTPAPAPETDEDDSWGGLPSFLRRR